jgi:hypothetical protein
MAKKIDPLNKKQFGAVTTVLAPLRRLPLDQCLPNGSNVDTIYNQARRMVIIATGRRSGGLTFTTSACSHGCANQIKRYGFADRTG